MYNIHGERSGGYSGIAFAVCILASALIPGLLPDPSAPAGEIVSAFQGHRQQFLIAMWLNFPAIAFFLWFAVGMRAYLLQAEGQDEGLPTYALAAAIVTSAIGLVAASALSALSYSSGADVPPGALKALYAFTALVNGALTFPLVAFVFGVAHSMRRHASAPGWLVWLGYLTAAAGTIATFSVFATGGAWSPLGTYPLAVPFLLFVIWLICSSVVLIRSAPLRAGTMHTDPGVTR